MADSGAAGGDAPMIDGGPDGSGDEGAGGSGAGGPQPATSAAKAKRPRAPQRTADADNELVEQMRVELGRGKGRTAAIRDSAKQLGRSYHTVVTHWYRKGVCGIYEQKYGPVPGDAAALPAQPPLPAPPPHVPPPLHHLAPAEAEMPDAQPAGVATAPAPAPAPMPAPAAPAPAPAAQQPAQVSAASPLAACASPPVAAVSAPPLASPATAAAPPVASETDGGGAGPSQPSDAAEGGACTAAEAPAASAAPTQESMTAEVLRKLLAENATQAEAAFKRTELHRHLLDVFYGKVDTSVVTLPKKDLDLCNNKVLHALRQAGLLVIRDGRPPKMHLTPDGVAAARAAAGGGAPGAAAQCREAEQAAAALASDALYGRNKRAADAARERAAAAVERQKAVHAEVEAFLRQHNRRLFDERAAAAAAAERCDREVAATDAQGAARACVRALTEELSALQQQLPHLPPLPKAGIYRVASLNVGGCYFGGKAGAKLANGVVLLARCAAHAMVLTEVAPDALPQLQQLCRDVLPGGAGGAGGGTRWRAALSAPHDRRECVAFLWDSSKLRCDGAVQALACEPDVELERSRPPAYCSFSATSAENQLDFTLFGVHFSPIKATALRQLAQLATHLRSSCDVPQRRRTLIAGDFNLEPRPDDFACLTTLDMVRVRCSPDASEDPGTTLDALTQTGRQTIDHFWLHAVAREAHTPTARVVPFDERLLALGAAHRSAAAPDGYSPEWLKEGLRLLGGAAQDAGGRGTPATRGLGHLGWTDHRAVLLDLHATVREG